MSEIKKLNGLTALVTRPKPRGEILCEAIRSQGGHAIYFPTIEIICLSNQEMMQHLESFNWLIFISPQAVYQTTRFITALPVSLNIAAIGAGTAHALREAHLPVHACPQEEWNSEGLLALPAFQNVVGQKIAIVKGEGGREWLENTLVERGASVTSLIAYKRILPQSNDWDELRQNKMDVIICTSNEGLQNLKTLTRSSWDSLKNIPVIVISERMEQYARALGCQKIWRAQNASHAAIIEIMQKEKNMENQNTSPEKKPAKSARSIWFSWYLIGTLSTAISLVVLIFLFFATNFYYIHYLSGKDQTQKNKSEIQTVVGAIQQDMARMNDEIKSQQEIINAFRQTQSGYHRNEWRVLEAEFLVKIANEKLQFENSPAQALILLQHADQQLRDVNDESLLPIRKALANDIAMIQALPKVDVSGLYMRLMAVNAQLDKLPLPDKPVNASQAQAAQEKLPWWKQGLRDSWEKIKKIVVVQYHQNGAPALMMPEQKDFLYQNMHASLEKAMWALLHGQSDIFHASIQQTIDWLRNYFVLNVPVTQSVLDSLTQIQAIDIHPTLPVITESPQTFQTYFATHQSQ